MTLLVAPVLFHLFRKVHEQLFPFADPLRSAGGWIQLIALLVTLWLMSFAVRLHSPQLLKKIWKNRSLPPPKPYSSHLLMGFFTWFVGFPIVLAIGQCADLFIDLVFGVTQYEQVAVRYLKMTLSSPSLLALALSTILFMAPIIEEFLFKVASKPSSNGFFPLGMPLCSPPSALLSFILLQAKGSAIFLSFSPSSLLPSF